MWLWLSTIHSSQKHQLWIKKNNDRTFRRCLESVWRVPKGCMMIAWKVSVWCLCVSVQVFVVVVVLVILIVNSVDPKNLPLKFCQTWVSYRWNIVVVVVAVYVVVIVIAVAVVNPRDQPLKFGQNWVNNSWDNADIEFVWVGGWGRVEW